ncbi:MAG TPA: hypothetical protein VIR26_01245 [Metalysinibacillus sp.]
MHDIALILVMVSVVALIVSITLFLVAKVLKKNKNVPKKAVLASIVVLIISFVTFVNTIDEDQLHRQEHGVSQNDDLTDAKEPEERIVLPKDTIKQTVEGVIADDLSNVTIKKIDINEHAGRNDGTYIVLPHLKLDAKNSASTTLKILEQYSDHIAAKLADITEVSEITVFWEVPYHLEGNNVAKFMYERSGDGMVKVDKWSALQ